MTSENLHQNWLDQKKKDGWVYGKTKDAEKKTHPCMVPYSDLPKEQQVKDHLFHAIVSILTSFQAEPKEIKE
jgi:RyR domain.